MEKTSLLGFRTGKTLIIDVDKITSVLAGEDVDIHSFSENLQEIPKIIQELQVKNDYVNFCLDILSRLERFMLAILG